ncbi:MAG: hypothetical protein R2702_08015 [Acidimicrobiales bacterium]
MSRVRKLGPIVLVAVAVVAGASACSKSDGGATESDRKVVTFGEAPEGSTDLGLCGAYDIEQMKGFIGGDESFKRLAPEAIGKEGDPVTGEACAWERVEGGDSLSLRIEVRNYGDDATGAAARFDELEQEAVDPEPVSELGDRAFSSTSDGASVLQAVRGGYLLSLSSRSAGSLEPLPTDVLKLLGTAGLERLS